MQESRRRFKDWVRSEEVRKEGGEGVEVSHVSVGDGVPLWVWRGTTDIPAASPKTVFERIWYQRSVPFQYLNVWFQNLTLHHH